MAIQIKLKNSVVQDSTPSTSDLPAVGEIALNANINSIGGFMRASDNSIVKIFGPGSLSTPTATTTVSGISEHATNSETTTGTATNRVVTPAGLNAVTVAERSTSNSTYLALAGGTLTGVVAATAGSNSAPSIHFGDSDSGIFGGTNTVSLAAGGTTRLTADTGVSVVGTLAVTGAITSTSDLTIADKIIHSGDTNTAVRFPAADTVSVETAGSERARIDSSGRLLVGQSASVNVASTTAGFLQIASSTGTINSSFAAYGNNSSPCMIAIGRSRSGTVGSAGTALQNNDVIGLIRFAGDDGTDLQSQAASIAVEVDGTPGANDMPGRLVFSTTADGAASPTTRLTIDSAGLATFANAVSITGNLTIADKIIHSGDTDTFLEFLTNTITFDTAGSERARISSDGLFAIGTDSPAENLHITAASNVGIRLDDSGHSYANFIYNNGSNSTDALTIAVDEGNTQSASTMRFRVDASEKARFTADGDFAVGTTSPSTKVHIVTPSINSATLTTTSCLDLGLRIASSGASNTTGHIKNGITLGDGYAGLIGIDYGGSAATGLGFWTGSNTGVAERARITSAGLFAIGTDSPTAELTISAATPEIHIIDSDVSRTIKVFNSNGNLYLQSHDSDRDIIFRGSTTEVARFTGDGDFSVGSTTPKARAYVKGSGNGSGASAIDIENSDNTELFKIKNDGSFATGVASGSPINFTGGSANVHIDTNGRLRTVSSSKKYKEDIKNALWGLAEVLKLRPVTFKYKTQSKEDKKYAGFTAEELHDLGLKDFVDYRNNQPDSINYPNMVALMAKAIQELNAKITKLETA